jgi:signal transduction histidine kinase
MVVADDGQGFDEHAVAGPAQGHFGLHVMRERVERLGGRLEMTSRPGHGTTIFARVRLRGFEDSPGDPSPLSIESTR